MKCRTCGSEWNISDPSLVDLTECPFCHSKIGPEESSVREVLRWIVDTCSIDVFLNAGIINSILADMAKDNEKERRTIKLALSSGAGTEFHRIWKRCDGQLYDSDIKEITACIEELGFAETFVSYVVNTFLYAVSYSSTPYDGLICDDDNLYRAGLEFYKKQDYREALRLFKKAAEQGDLFAYILF